MTKTKRLEALEADTITAWRAAWERSALTFEDHMSGLHVNTTDLLQGLQAELPDLTDAEVERACKEFLHSIGVLSFDAFAKWFSSYELPDPDADRPDLSAWPADVPNPPDELPAEWEVVLPYASSDDLLERLAAQVHLFILASARTAREGRAAS